MPNKSIAAVRKVPALDPRTARTTNALGRALVALIQERDFDRITVQQILDRAGVGRTTFYTHFRSKEDVLFSSYERLFSALDHWLDREADGARRLFPVAEFLAHVGEMDGLVAALRGAGRLDELWSMCATYAARTIERRIAGAAANATGVPPRLVARMLAGALLEAIEWWLDHRESATPAEMDRAFHALAWRVLGARL
jgi:AcrR family transcriptional regulator